MGDLQQSLSVVSQDDDIGDELPRVRASFQPSSSMRLIMSRTFNVNR